MDHPPRPEDKSDLRARLKSERRAHVAALPQSLRALIFSRPPAPVVSRIPEGAAIGLYHAHANEAPTLAYAKWFHEQGHPLALPWFADRDGAMAFRQWSDPYDDNALEPGPFVMAQPAADCEAMTPDVLFVPLVGFTAQGDRLGQGGGHYDRWLADHPDTLAIGLAWDEQHVDALPVEPHDRPLDLIVTPTRLYERSA